MNLIDYSTDQIFSQLIRQQEVFNSIKYKIQTLVPKQLSDQFNVVGLTDNQLIIYADNSLVSHYLYLRKRDIPSLLQEWEIRNIKIKIRIKQIPPSKTKITTPKLSISSRDQLLKIAYHTHDDSLKKFLLAIIDHHKD